MKTRILLFATLSILILFNCSKKNVIQSEFNYKINHENSSYEIDNKKDLKNFISSIVKDENIIFQKYSKEILLDENSSKFQAITAKYSTNGTTVSLVIPLSIEPNKSNDKSSFLVDCTMDCRSQTGSSTCDLIVYEKCRRQACSSTEEGSTCSSTVAFF